jgi:hypothetical protein
VSAPTAVTGIALPVVSAEPPLRLTGSLVGQHFRFRCDRLLRYDLVPESERGPDVPRANADPARGPLVGARAGMEMLAAAGRRFERRRLRDLVARFGEEAVLAAGWDARGNPLRLEYPDVVRALRDPGPVRFLVQPELRLVDAGAFAARVGFPAERVRVAPSQPDLIRIRRRPGRSPRLEVADIKWSREGAIPHFTQVAFYTLLLEEVVRAEGIGAEVETRWGWLWTRGARTPRRFALPAYRHHVEEMLAEDLPRIAAEPPAAAAWHLAPRCAGCRYFAHCRDEADRAGDLARVPGITPLAKQVLASRRIRTVKELGLAGLRKGTYTGCHALEAGEPALKKRADALRFGKVFDVEGRTLSMGAGEAVRILLSAEGDPVSGTCFAVGLRVERAGGGGPGGGEGEVFLSTAGTRRAEREMLVRFLDRLGAVVREVVSAAEGAGRGGKGGRAPSARRREAAAHLFVFDRTDLEALRGMVERHAPHLEVQPLVAGLAPLLFPPDAAAGTAPGTVLLDAVTELFALPVPYAYDLATVSAVLQPARDAAVFAPPPGFAWPFSSQVAFERAHDGWAHRPRRGADGAPVPPEAVREAVAATVRAKLAAVDSVIRAVRERSERRREGRLAMEPFVPGGAGEEPIAHPVLESLRLFVRMEAAAEALALRALHALPSRDRARRFEAIRGMELVERRADGRLVFEFDPECREAKFRPGDFTLLLTNEDTDGLAEAGRLAWKRRALMMELVEYDLGASPPRVVLAPSSGFAKAEAEGWIYLDRVCVLDRAPSDFNTERVVATLRALADGHGEAEFVTGLLEGRVPDGWTAPLDPAGGLGLLARAAGAYGRPVLNAEQERAWREAFGRAVSVIWGPPGTGKTYLLAWMLLGMAASAAREGQAFRILVTSATHRAVVNVLVRIAREVEAAGVPSPLRAVKLAGSGAEADRDLEGTPVEVVDDRKLASLLAAADAEGRPVVVGSTVWSLWKQMRKADGGEEDGAAPGEVPVASWFDVVVVDEASQVRVPDALVALSSLRRGGRVVLCGDDRQLAPVVHGSYGAGAGTLFGSAFTHFATRFGRTPLWESRRMNRALVEYPRELFYPGLVSRVPDHALRARPPEGGWGDPLDVLLWELFFRPEDAVVLCTYDGFRATARNPFEAALAARLAALARRGLRDPRTGEAYSAEGFAREAFAVLSPHRAQNAAILGELAALGWPRGEMPVVDTVERMQGNEREMIVVSYAVADGEYAEREAEFLLSPNRFNVAVTRARAKLVLFASEAVLRTLPASEEVMSGSMALKGYPRHCADGLREVELPAPGGGGVRVKVRYRRL